MKKTLLVIVYFASAINNVRAQRTQDLIISINNQIVSNIFNAKILVKRNAEIRAIPIQYYPGNISIKGEDYDSLPDTDSTLFLVFDYIYYSSKGNQYNKSYEIGMGKNWFDKKYVIIKIYTLSGSRAKGIIPLNGKDYNYDVEYAGGQAIRIRNR